MLVEGLGTIKQYEKIQIPQHTISTTRRRKVRKNKIWKNACNVSISAYAQYHDQAGRKKPHPELKVHPGRSDFDFLRFLN